jgi:hypothetical protein
LQASTPYLGDRQPDHRAPALNRRPQTLRDRAHADRKALIAQTAATKSGRSRPPSRPSQLAAPPDSPPVRTAPRANDNVRSTERPTARSRSRRPLRNLSNPTRRSETPASTNLRSFRHRERATSRLPLQPGRRREQQRTRRCPNGDIGEVSFGVGAGRFPAGQLGGLLLVRARRRLRCPVCG